MGRPSARLPVATNVNDILARTLATGTYEIREVVATASPSMDIQVSSNFERLLFEAYGRDSKPVRAAMASPAQSRHFSVAGPALAAMRARFTAHRASEAETAAAIRTTLRETGNLIDPHTGVAIAVAEKESRDPSVPMVVLSTAHAAKFPDAVEHACGVRPQLPDWLADLRRRTERGNMMPPDPAAVERFVLGVTRTARAGIAATGVETTRYCADTIKDEVPLALHVLSDILTAPAFDPDEMTREKNVSVQEIGAGEDAPDDWVFESRQGMAFADQPLGRSI